MGVFGWFGRKRNEASGSGAKIVRVYLNPLHAMLGAAEKQKGSPLTEAEVLHVRDTSVAIDMTQEQAEKFYASLDAQMPIGRLDPTRIWEEWQEVRGHVMKQLPGNNYMTSWFLCDVRSSIVTRLCSTHPY
jgi:hypothetical protein